MFTAQISNCFDSHLHWLATGDVASRLDLRSLRDPAEVARLSVQSHHYRGAWLIGFGWDETIWSEPPHRKHLDEVFPDTPVAFSRADGHALWVNTVALKQVGLFRSFINTSESEIKDFFHDVEGGRISTDAEGWPTGVLVDRAREAVDKKIPSVSQNTIREFLRRAQALLHQKGITHIRDMSCSEEQWNEACRLDEAGELKLYVLQNFSVDKPEDFHEALRLAERARRHATPHLFPAALKIYYDGALGSEGALLSQDYGSGSGRGFRLAEPGRMFEIMKEISSHNWDIAVHVIGDQAVHEIVQIGRRLWDEGFKNKIHLEHVELLRDETLQLMKGRGFICHLQPSHWLSDRRWAREKLGSLYSTAFRWRALERQGTAFYFGSDAPIEPLGLERTLRALQVAAEDGIEKMAGNPLCPHSCDLIFSQLPTFSIFKDGHLEQLMFDGKILL